MIFRNILNREARLERHEAIAGSFFFFGEIKYERVANMEIKREDGGQNIRNKSVNASRKNLNVSYKLRYSRILLLRSEI